MVRQEGGGVWAPSRSTMGVQLCGSRWIILFTSSRPTMFSQLPENTGTREWPRCKIWGAWGEGGGWREEGRGEGRGEAGQCEPLRAHGEWCAHLIHDLSVDALLHVQHEHTLQWSHDILHHLVPHLQSTLHYEHLIVAQWLLVLMRTCTMQLHQLPQL